MIKVRAMPQALSWLGRVAMIVVVLVMAAPVAVITATAQAATQATQATPATQVAAGLRITGTMTFSMFIPAAVFVFGGDSGGETQTGTFKIDLRSAHLPFDDAWTSDNSSYTFTDKVDAHQAGGQYGCPAGASFTANASGGGDFPQRPRPTSNTFIDAQWWYHRHDTRPAAPLIYVGGQVATHEEVKIKSPCGENTEYFRPYEVAPACLKLPLLKIGGYGTGGPFDGKDDTINLDCTGPGYDIHGTLHVDAYMFVLPRAALKPAQWRYVLTKPHLRYPAADIPVPEGTPFYAVTAGLVRVYSNPTCGPHAITLVGMDGFHYTYCHASQAIVANGEEVPPGTELGLTGHEGSRSTGPHLHFELRINNVQHCPQALLWNLYDGAQPPPDAKFVHSLPVTGCSYKNK